MPMADGLAIILECPRCRNEYSLDRLRPTRIDLNLLRRSVLPILCKVCGSDIDTTTAYCGQRSGSEIVRLEDPGYI